MSAADRQRAAKEKKVGTMSNEYIGMPLPGPER